MFFLSNILRHVPSSYVALQSIFNKNHINSHNYNYQKMIHQKV